MAQIPTHEALPPEVCYGGGVDIYAEGRLRHLHLKIGEGIVALRPALISTVLGSCVAATFFHEESGMAAIFHAMLPTAVGSRDGDTTPCKYVDTAINTLLSRFERERVPLSAIEVKLFGGSYSLNNDDKRATRTLVDVGGRNVEMARERLAARGLDPRSEHVMGDRGRKLVFHAGTGEVWVRMLGMPDTSVSEGWLSFPRRRTPTRR